MTERAHLIATFQHYGLPDRLLVDNGSPWGNHPAHPYTPIDMHRESEWSNESARRPGQTEQRGRGEVRRDGPDLTKSSTEADSDATPSLGIETVYVRRGLVSDHLDALHELADEDLPLRECPIP